MEKKLFIRLVKKYLAGKATASETALLEAYYDRLGEKKRTILSAEQEAELEERLLEGVLRRMDASTSGQIRRVSPLYRRTWFRAAAAVLLLAAATVVFWSLYGNGRQIPQAGADEGIQTLDSREDLAPGGNKALLTLADGSVISLDEAEKGIVRKTRNADVLKLVDGQLQYRQLKGNPQHQVVYNTLSTPEGGQYQLILSDGTKVWLNAASSIRYPTAFIGNERKVEISGEVYFEVEKVAGKTFKVIAPSPGGPAAIEVLGTHFNVKAYENESPVKATLLEGSVRLSKGSENTLLKPGQQAQVGDSAIRVVDGVDIEAAIAWKDGMFQFSDTDLLTILKQLERWYGADVHYEDVPKLHFSGTISRDVYLSQVLKMLEITGNIRFEIIQGQIKLADKDK